MFIDYWQCAIDLYKLSFSIFLFFINVSKHYFRRWRIINIAHNFPNFGEKALIKLGSILKQLVENQLSQISYKVFNRSREEDERRRFVFLMILNRLKPHFREETKYINKSIEQKLIRRDFMLWSAKSSKILEKFLRFKESRYLARGKEFKRDIYLYFS